MMHAKGQPVIIYSRPAAECHQRISADSRYCQGITKIKI